MVNLFEHAMMRLQFAHVRFCACRGKLRNLLADCSAVGLCCVTIVRQLTLKHSPHVGQQAFSACDQGFFSPRSAFFSRPECLGLIMKKIALNLGYLKR